MKKDLCSNYTGKLFLTALYKRKSRTPAFYTKYPALILPKSVPFYIIFKRGTGIEINQVVSLFCSFYKTSPFVKSIIRRQPVFYFLFLHLCRKSDDRQAVHVIPGPRSVSGLRIYAHNFHTGDLLFQIGPKSFRLAPGGKMVNAHAEDFIQNKNPYQKNRQKEKRQSGPFQPFHNLPPLRI